MQVLVLLKCCISLGKIIVNNRTLLIFYNTTGFFINFGRYQLSNYFPSININWIFLWSYYLILLEFLSNCIIYCQSKVDLRKLEKNCNIHVKHFKKFSAVSCELGSLHLLHPKFLDPNTETTANKFNLIIKLFKEFIHKNSNLNGW